MTVFNYDLQESVVLIIRIIATIGGAVVGWFVCDPLTRVAYRLSFRAATPGALLFCGKAIGGTALAAAVWFAWPDGNGGGGPGFGPGLGGLPGKGGAGSDKSVADDPVKNTTPPKEKTDAKEKTPDTVEPIEIEVIGAKLYTKLLEGDGTERWYLLKGKPLSLRELEDYFKANHSKIEVTPVLKRDSINLGRQELLDLGKKYSVKMLQFKTP